MRACVRVRVRAYLRVTKNRLYHDPFDDDDDNDNLRGGGGGFVRVSNTYRVKYKSAWVGSLSNTSFPMRYVRCSWVCRSVIISGI